MATSTRIENRAGPMPVILARKSCNSPAHAYASRARIALASASTQGAGANRPVAYMKMNTAVPTTMLAKNVM